MKEFRNVFTTMSGATTPLICGAMYPCSNPELVAAVSAAGGVGMIQPLSFSYVYGLDLRAAIRSIRQITEAPIGFNAVIEKGSAKYAERMRAWVNIALEENIKFFVTALGNPTWVVRDVHEAGGVVFHNVTERRWGQKAKDCGVDGLICVNNRAGGHAGNLSASDMYQQLSDLKLPLVCGGGVSDPAGFVDAIKQGYVAVQMGTRFIATYECAAHQSYKEAIVAASEEDIVLTERVTAVPLSVIRTPYVESVGTSIGWFGRLLLQQPKLRHFVRLLYSVVAARGLKRSALLGASSREYWQAGKSVGKISSIVSASDFVRECRMALDTLN